MIWIAAALVVRLLRIWAQGPGHDHGSNGRGSRAFNLAGDDHAGRGPLLHLVFQSCPGVPLRIGSPGPRLPELVSAGSIAAVLHAGNHVEANK